MTGSAAARLAFALLTGVGLGFWLRDRQVVSETPGQAPIAVTGPSAAAPSEVRLDPEPLLANLAATRDFLSRWFPALAAGEEPKAPDYSPERVLYDQYRLVDEALAALRPQTPGHTDLYVVAFAGDGDENVFRNEVEYVDKLFSERYGARDRVVVLANNPATVETRPLATWTNLELVLDGLLEHDRFDPDEDILLLFMTSHGDEEHNLYVGMDLMPLDWIAAEDLSRTLSARPFRWRVSIISACYSGGFLEGLKNSTSMVITAARADRTSFGCGVDSDITYFGKAFLVEGLNQTDTFRGAFEIARQLVGDWERAENQPASEPQIASTPLIEAKLAQWRRGVTLGPVQPFAVAADASSRSEASSARP
ncbi:MAG: peptidase C13 [Rhodanobacteraceae bacterium]|nr:peptidase C13 [Rhodanobacteraceae bacterium]